MKQFGIIVLFMILTQYLSAQKTTNAYAAVDKKALEIPESQTSTTNDIAAYIKQNFSTETDKARAIFIWIATNIEYDIENIFAINFYEKDEDRIKRVLTIRKGICSHYAALFHDIASKAGLRSYIIVGYTKQNGFTDYIPHAWCAASIDNAWYIFDPTWGSGYVNNSKFYKKINNEYFKALPSVMIASHMPFDFMWQFLNYPVTNQEFYEGKTGENKSKPYFSYTDSIAAYEKMGNIEQMQASARRIEKNGLKNSMIFDRMQHLKLEIENTQQNEAVTLYNSAVVDYNEAINNFNTYIYYYNKQFTPAKKDAEIKQMVDVVDIDIQKAKNKLNAIKYADNNMNQMTQQLRKSINELIPRIEEQKEWVEKYLGKSKLGRKTMFQKFTWMGVPLN